MSKKLSRRAFMEMCAVLTTSGVLAWGLDKLEAETDVAPDIGVDPATTGENKMGVTIATNYAVDFEAPFAPYFVESDWVYLLENAEDGDAGNDRR